MKKSKSPSNNRVREKARFDPLPPCLEAFLLEKGLKKPDMLAVVRCDLSRDGSYGTTWAILTNEALIVTEGEEKDTYIPHSYGVYPLEELQKVRTERLLSTGTLVGVYESGDHPLCTYTNSCSIKMGYLAEIINKMKKGEEVNFAEYEEKTKDGFCPDCGTPYPDPSLPVCPKCTNKRKLLMRVLSYAPRYIKEIFFILFFMGIVTLTNLVTPYLHGVVLYDQVLTEGGKYYGMIIPILLLLFGTDTLKMVCELMQARIGASVAAKIIYDIKVELFSAMQKLSMSFYNSKQTGSLMTRVNHDALDIQYFLNEGFPFIIVNLTMLIGMSIVMFQFDPLLTLLVFLPLPVAVYVVKRVIPKVQKLQWRTFTKNSKLNSVINDTLSGMRVVKAFGKEDTEIDRFEGANGEFYAANVAAGKKSALVFPTLSWIMNIGGLFVWGFGGWKVFSGTGLTFGVLMTFVNYLNFIYGPLNYLLNCFDWWTRCMNSAKRIFEIIDRRPDVVEAKQPVPMPDIKGDIELRNVTFAYEPNKPVLHGINLHIEPGEMIGLVGHSGAGKSTITNLITRLYDVTDGAITVDGVNIKDIKLKDLRSQIGMVLQDTFLFSGTILENIAYARPDATREEIITAAKLANAHDFIMRLTDGYDTVLGKRQSNLSGGEKQRISIARAILVDPKILILDEATASVDTETERLIQEALERLVKGRTTIAIAHRLSTLRNANRLVVVDKGTIAEVGTHAELEEKKGIYYKMLQMQKEALKLKGLSDES